MERSLHALTPIEPRSHRSAGIPSRLDAANSPDDVVDLWFLDAFARCGLPYSRMAELRRAPADIDLGTLGGELVVEHRDHWNRALWEGDGWLVRVNWRTDAEGTVWIAAGSRADADAVAAEILALDGPPVRKRTDVRIGFWSLGGHGPHLAFRTLAAPTWRAIRNHYAPPVATAVERLVGMRKLPSGGRLILLHGPPGTGKTTVLRALARQWRTWCTAEYVVDPEVMFGNAAYLANVLGRFDDHEETKRSRLLILEDCDELLRGDAKSRSGQGLARLLNLGDGMLGQGIPLMVCITTNEPLARLHPAVTRPGRCLASIAFSPLDRADAARLLGAPEASVPSAGMTLAEVIARRDGTMVTAAETADRAPGLYL